MPETTKKLFTKKHYKKLEEKKYEQPTDRAAEIISQAEPSDRLKIKIRTTGKPKVLEASRITCVQEVKIFRRDVPFDSEKIMNS